MGWAVGLTDLGLGSRGDILGLGNWANRLGTGE